MKRIICIGNRYVKEDSAGPLVYDELKSRKSLPPRVDIIDGGLAGLDLLPFFETSQKVVLVDSVVGSGGSEAAENIGESDGVVILDPSKVSKMAQDHYGHSAGIGYLLRILPEVCEGGLPDISIVAIEGEPDLDKIKKAAEISLKMVE